MLPLCLPLPLSLPPSLLIFVPSTGSVRGRHRVRGPWPCPDSGDRTGPRRCLLPLPLPLTLSLTLNPNEVRCLPMNLLSGLDRVVEDPAVLTGRRWALLANHAAVTRELDPARQVLAAVLGSPVRLFAAEHGLDGVAQDMEGVNDAVDPVTGARVRSLYGHDAASLKPTGDDLDGVDAVVVDLPDIGTRYYTFAASMDAMMVACRDHGREVVVLDRPNPIGGVLREGGPVEPGFESFVGQIPTPVRHGLTLGEIALLLQRERYPELGLTVVQCSDWSRSTWWDRTVLPWVPPSPNMPTLETAAIYPGLCLIEATTLSEGRGTTRPFHLVGAPWADAEGVAARLRRLDLPGIAFRPTRFRPQFQKWAGQVCGGIELHVTDREALQPLRLGLEIVHAFRAHHPGDFAWRPDPYEFVADVPALDLLTGSPAARLAIENGDSLADLCATWDHWRTTEFEPMLDGVLIYR
jgi:uncharacterized protein YbbC (DUF1343 family)